MELTDSCRLYPVLSGEDSGRLSISSRRLLADGGGGSRRARSRLGIWSWSWGCSCCGGGLGRRFFLLNRDIRWSRYRGRRRLPGLLGLLRLLRGHDTGFCNVLSSSEFPSIFPTATPDLESQQSQGMKEIELTEHTGRGGGNVNASQRRQSPVPVHV